MSIKKQLAALLPAFLLLSLLQAQLPAADSVVQAFRQAESQLILLKNEKQLIPLQRLDTLRIAVLSIGLPADGDFETILARYMPVQVEALSPFLVMSFSSSSAASSSFTTLGSYFVTSILSNARSPSRTTTLP